MIASIMVQALILLTGDTEPVPYLALQPFCSLHGGEPKITVRSEHWTEDGKLQISRHKTQDWHSPEDYGGTIEHGGDRPDDATTQKCTESARII